VVGLLAFAAAALPTLRHGAPRPTYHDELSYLLAADTFAHGRLANPTHPHWQHFESFYVLHQPRYASKYPPGQGLLLALGQRLGAPIIGVWLGVAALCAATTWMLRAYVPARWAFLGGMLAVAQIALLSYWSQSYWGGALAACGGALVFGALPRIVRRRPDAVALVSPVVLAGGLLVLANTRPFEGALVSLAAAWPLLAWLPRAERRPERWRVVGIPLLVVLALGFLAMGRYNRAVTGHTFRLPFNLYDEQYHVRPLFMTQTLRPVPEYRHDILRRYFAGVEVHEFEAQQTFSGWARLRLRRLEQSRAVLLGPVLTLPLLLIPLTLRARGVGLAVGGLVLLLLAVVVTNHHYPHYAAPMFALVMLLVVQGWRSLILRVSRRGLTRGILMSAILVAAIAARLAIPDPVLRVGAARSSNRAKATVEEQLEALGGRHLVFVRQGPFADVHDDWIWNGADIDARRIVWARAMSPAEDAVLRAYYGDRRAWRVDIAIDQPGVVDFSEIAPGAESETRRQSSAAQPP
jgi:hypothetical protein